MNQLNNSNSNMNQSNNSNTQHQTNNSLIINQYNKVSRNLNPITFIDNLPNLDHDQELSDDDYVRLGLIWLGYLQK